MKRFLFFLSIILGISLGVNAQSKNVFILSQFSFEDTSGKKFSLDTLKGKVVFIDCWFPGCPPCRAEMPYSKLLQNRLHRLQMDSNIVFVTISFKQSKEEWLTALKTLPMPNAIHLYSPAGTYEMAIAGGNYPTYKIFNIKGELDNEICPLPSEIGFIDFVLFAAQKGIEVNKAKKIFLSQTKDNSKQKSVVKEPILKTFFSVYAKYAIDFKKSWRELKEKK